MSGNTFTPISLSIDDWPQADYDTFVKDLRKSVAAVKQNRLDWYSSKRAESAWVNIVRRSMVWLGSGAALATALAAACRVIPWPDPKPNWDIYLLVAAVILYAGMGAVAFFERTAEGVGSYFRSITAIIQIRDLWTAYQFTDAHLALEAPPVTPTEILAAKLRRLDAAQTFVKALELIAAQELTEWRGAFQAAMGQLSAEAKTGLSASQTALAEAIKADAVAAKAAADDAKKALEAIKPASLNLEVAFAPAGEAVVKVDGETVRRGTGRSYVVSNITQGEHIVRVEVTLDPVTNPPAIKAAEQKIVFGPGITGLKLTPT